MFWIDAQLPPAIASWLRAEFGVQASALRDLGLRDASDADIFEAARAADVVIVSKDSDFVELISRHGSPPRLLWITCGNVTNTKLQAVFKRGFNEAIAQFTSGQAMIELG